MRRALAWAIIVIAATAVFGAFIALTIEVPLMLVFWAILAFAVAVAWAIMALEKG